MHRDLVVGAHGVDRGGDYLIEGCEPVLEPRRLLRRGTDRDTQTARETETARDTQTERETERVVQTQTATETRPSRTDTDTSDSERDPEETAQRQTLRTSIQTPP
eukprot:1637129-Rhodomonas_salina.1